MTIFYTVQAQKLNPPVLSAQTFCHTPNHSKNQFLNTMMRSSTLSDNSYCAKIYMHVIRRTNGTGGEPIYAVNQAFQILNDDFNPHGISFNWDGVIDYIDNDSYYNVDVNPDIENPIFNINNHFDGIDIYIFSRNGSPFGLANGVGESSELLVSGRFWEYPQIPLLLSHAISHEMGHVLFLWHTFHGTAEGGNDNPCAELVNGSNADTCGDYVIDTPADPNMNFNTPYPNCEWTGSDTDANGDNYNPDEQNIMAYTNFSCMDYFTSLQGSRARNALATLPFLQQTVVSCCVGDDLDLYIKDSDDDDGAEPNPTTDNMWTSPDIWIRNNNDNGLMHQNPEYRTNGNPNYINVRVINKSCVASTGTEILTVNWAKANTALAWPQNWDGSLTNGTHPLGGALSNVSIPIIPAGGEAIVKIPWVVPNPDNYSDNDNPWHFCLLSRINATDDPLTSPLTSNPNVMVRNNNNLAWKNLTVVDLVADRTSAMVMIANPSNTPKTYYLELQKATNEGGKAIYEEAEVTLKMDDVIYDAWERGGKQAQLIASKHEEKSKLVKGDNVILDNIMFEPNERGLLTLDFNFLTKELTDKTEFTYHIVQKDANTGEVIGGETFLIKKKSRPIFIANAGNDKEIDENETITLSAKQINEAAIYNWYDTDGNLIYQGKDLTVSADVTKKYKLEIVAETDGYKDYDEIQVKLKPSIIENISPNPASNQMQVNYKLNGVSSAYLMIIGQYGTSNNYVLNTTSSQTTINLSNYTNGFYTVALVCNGEIVDAKTLIKQ